MKGPGIVYRVLLLFRLLAFAGAAGMLAKGHGSKIAFMVASGLYLSGCLGLVAATTESNTEGSARDATVKVRTICAVCVSALGCVFPQLLHLFGFSALLAGLAGDATLVCAFLATWVFQETIPGMAGASGTTAAIFFSLCVLLTLCISPTKRRWLAAVLASTAIILTVPQLTTSQSNRLTVKGADTRLIGPVVARLLDSELKPFSEAQKHVPSGIVQVETEHLPPLLLLEHDMVLRGGNVQEIDKVELQQNQPWFRNQLEGNQYALAAIEMDGYLASNLGGQMELEGHEKVLLMSRAHHPHSGLQTRTWPVLIEDRETRFLNDSDPFVNRLAAYQRNFITEVVLGTANLRWTNIFTAVAAVLALFGARTPVVIAILCVFSTVAVLPEIVGLPGDVRIVGAVDSWPHDPSATSGVLRALADADYPLISGTRQTTILVVGAGQKAAPLETEKLVLLGPGSTLRVGSMTITAGELPIGTAAEILDGRELWQGKQRLGPDAMVGNIRIIGTGSPARQNWKRLLEPSSR